MSQSHEHSRISEIRVITHTHFIELEPQQGHNPGLSS